MNMAHHFSESRWSAYKRVYKNRIIAIQILTSLLIQHAKPQIKALGHEECSCPD